MDGGPILSGRGNADGRAAHSVPTDDLADAAGDARTPPGYVSIPQLGPASVRVWVGEDHAFDVIVVC